MKYVVRFKDNRSLEIKADDIQVAGNHIFLVYYKEVIVEDRPVIVDYRKAVFQASDIQSIIGE